MSRLVTGSELEGLSFGFGDIFLNPLWGEWVGVAFHGVNGRFSPVGPEGGERLKKRDGLVLDDVEQCSTDCRD